jgi:hypothetical protein
MPGLHGMADFAYFVSAELPWGVRKGLDLNVRRRNHKTTVLQRRAVPC